MPRAMTIPVAWLALVSVGFAQEAQEKYEFVVSVKGGESFDVEKQMVYSESVEGQSQSSTVLIGERLSVVKAEGGRAEQINRETTKWENDGLDLHAMMAQIGKADGIIRYEWVAGEYKPRLLDGNLTEDVAELLHRGHWDPLLEGLLPSKPLAVGESEQMDLKNLNRLGVDGFPLEEMTSSPKERVTFDEPTRITLQRVTQENGVRTAYLSTGFKARIEKTEVEKKTPDVGTLQYDGTVLFDLDRKFIIQAEVKINLEAPGERKGEPIVLSVNLTQVIRFKKQNPRP